MSLKEELLIEKLKIIKSIDTMEVEYYIICYKDKSQIISKYSRMDSIFELLKEMKK